MPDIAILGECMLEMAPTGQSNCFQQNFAGDVYSVAVYMARHSNSKVRVRLLTAVGEDAISLQFREALREERIDSTHILTHPSRHMGLYMVKNEADGERHFTYWRGESAAKDFFKITDSYEINPPDYFFISGISLAIYDEPSLFNLKSWLKYLKDRGTTIVFDPNYRPALWSSTAATLEVYAWAFSLCDIALPGIEDMVQLYGTETPDEVFGLLKNYDIGTTIIKNGAQPIWYATSEETGQVAVTPCPNVVDTTAAGDSFNAAFLAARLSGDSLTASIEAGSALASKVIQHRGAILPRQHP
ncbi:sugar kinase [Marinimicrobium agarilyticum]|uniref:sugar kinase n=1 Tax=Marinimicrobium agarilyticum TaxID=306546 RepID=UPI00047F469C|nr:sugar kinase [Marinimicrobium agarilyticum]